MRELPLSATEKSVDGGGDPIGSSICGPVGPNIMGQNVMEPYSKEVWKGKRVQIGAGASYTGSDAYSKNIDPFPTWASYTWKDSLDGFKNPHWKRQVARGENATTNMTATAKVLEVKEGHLQCIGNFNVGEPPNRRFKGVFTGLYGITPSTTLDTDGVPSGSADNDAVGDWYGKVRDRMSTFKGSVFAAESNQARRMMHDRASRMLTQIPYFQNRLRKRWLRSRTKRGKLKTLANSWLELQFGWLPLVSDIEDAYKVLHNPTPMFRMAKGEGVHFSVESKNSSTGGGNQMRYRTEQRRTTRYYVKYYGSIQARADPSGSRLLDWGLGTREFLPTIWEVIPWSFAVDYFTNIGEIITAVSYANVKVRWAARTIEIERVSDTRAFYDSPLGNFPYFQMQISIPSQFTLTAKKVLRSRIEDIPIPELSFRLPDWKKTLNLAALAVQNRLRLSY